MRLRVLVVVSIVFFLVSLAYLASAASVCRVVNVWFTDIDAKERFVPPLPGSRQYLVWVKLSCREPVKGVLLVEVHRYDPGTKTIIADENMAVSVARIIVSGDFVYASTWWPHSPGDYLLRVYLWNGLPGRVEKWESYTNYSFTLRVYNGTNNPCIDYCSRYLVSVLNATYSSDVERLGSMIASMAADQAEKLSQINATLSETRKVAREALLAALGAAALSATTLAAILVRRH